MSPIAHIRHLPTKRIAHADDTWTTDAVRTGAERPLAPAALSLVRG